MQEIWVRVKTLTSRQKSVIIAVGLVRSHRTLALREHGQKTSQHLEGNLMFKIRFAAILAVALLAGLSMPASAQENVEYGTSVKKSILKPPLVGNWEGQWVGRRRSGGLTVVFVTEATGTLIATGTDSFGSDPKSLSNVSVTGRVVKFRAGGFDVTTTMSSDATILDGTGWYGGYEYDVLLKRQ